MAFNFKWSPLAADTNFYARAKELLTAALNKSPKPPIIVDDIVVNELNLGDVPPDLEVLEIGDLDVDRFRGMFKMCYSGNAFLTLKTRVQANPLNTYLSTRPSFTSPQPLAAAAGLTIPIQITLSEIQLSAFIMLVYASQKGITLVFRNDPLESLRVSSTFDAIPFVRDYLQREIESQLRTLLMDELPLIIHRLSLRFFNKEAEENEYNATSRIGQEEASVDPLSSPPQDPVDLFGNVLDAAQITSLSLEPGSESQALFSQRNLLRLGALTESHRTLSLFTPTLRDTIFRASSGAYDRGGAGKFSHRPTPALSRSHSYAGSFAGSHTLSDSPTDSHFPSRHGALSGSGASNTNLSRYNKPGGRKKKHRVINLRKKAVHNADDSMSVSGSSATNSVEGTESIYSAPSQFDARPKTPEKEPGDMGIHRVSPGKRAATPPKASSLQTYPDPDQTPRQSQYLPQPPKDQRASNAFSSPRPDLSRSRTLGNPGASASSTKASPREIQKDDRDLKRLDPSPFVESSQSQPQQFEQSAWMNKIADEILRKVHERKAQDARFWDRRGSSASSVEEPPPAYGS